VQVAIRETGAFKRAAIRSAASVQLPADRVVFVSIALVELAETLLAGRRVVDGAAAH
jgi:hypothetical protein